jgi:predicted transcriptional regulator
MKLGDLERLIMNEFWDDPSAPKTVKELSDVFPRHAYTTIMTVMTRLAEKGFLRQARVGRAYEYRCVGTREDYVSGLILEALNSTMDREAALAHFVGSMPAKDRSYLRNLVSRNKRR